jgi:tetratricopeptide (TPR) repeat protein
MDLSELIAAVRCGEMGVARAIEQVDAAADSVGLRAAGKFVVAHGPAAARATFVPRRRKLLSEVNALIAELFDDEMPIRVADLGEVGAAAARLLHPGVEVALRWHVGRRLVGLRAHALAVEQFDRLIAAVTDSDAAAVLADDPDPETELQIADARVRRVESYWALGAVAKVEAAASELLGDGPVPNTSAASAATASAIAAADDAATALPTLSAVEHPGFVARLLLMRAQARSRLLRADDARADASRAIALRSQMSAEDADAQWTAGLGWFYQTLGDVHRGAGAFGDALEAYDAGRAAALQARDRYAAAYLLSEIGITWQQAGDLERGNQILDLAAGEADAIGAAAEAARWRTTRHDVTPPPGQTIYDDFTRAEAALFRAKQADDPALAAEAHRLITAALKEAVRMGSLELELSLRTRLGMSYDLMRSPMQAEMAFREALAVATDAGLPAERLMLLLNLGNTLGRRGRIDEANAFLREAIRTGEALRTAADSAELRQTITGRLADAYEYLAMYAAATVTHEVTQTRREPDAAALFEVAQLGRAVNLGRWFALLDACEQAPDPALSAALVDYRRAEVVLEATAMDVGRGIVQAAAAVDAAQQRFTRAARQAGIELPAERTLLAPRQCAEILACDECLLDLTSLDAGVAVCCLTPTGELHASLTSWRRDDRLPLLKRLARAAVRAIKYEAGDDAWGDADGVVEAYHAVLRQLRERLLDDVVKVIRSTTAAPVRHVIVSAHRDLFQVPFWQLAELVGRSNPAVGDGGASDDVSVSVVPSIAAYYALRRRQRPATGMRVAVGDATATLPYERTERDALAACGFTFAQPTADAIVAAAADATALHFTSHGLFDERNPYYSGLAVNAASSSSAAGSGDSDLLSRPWVNGFELFTVAQVVGRLHLPRCRLAVLSACETGLPRLHPASEFTGLPAAFLLAGAANVVASVWQAHDAAGALLMRGLCASLTRRPDAPVHAHLALARRELAATPRARVVALLGGDRFVPRNDPPFAAPMYTDVFQHYGTT